MYQGSRVTLDPAVKPTEITLVVTDDKGLTDFATVTTVPIDVLPGTSTNPLQLSSKGRVPVAVLTTNDLDATTIDAETLRFGPGAGKVDARGCRR